MGKVIDKNGSAIPGATIKVLKTDSSFVSASVADTSGRFMFKINEPGPYLLMFSFISYKNYYASIDAKGEPLRIGRILLKEESRTLTEVEIKTLQNRGEQKGDTTMFNADAFKVNQDATAEDLIKKMPGVTSDNNGVKVNGETVQKVMVDGKPFFGDDPNASIKNLPAEIIDKVEIFDRMSDQSQFSGFNDGDQQKTINFITKRNKNMGQFGRVYGGIGTDENLDAKYNVGAVINSFKSKQRITFLLLSNNINQQNFSASDITGSMGGSGGGRSGGGRSGGGGFGGSSPLMAASQNGITATQSAGLNYSDEWGKKTTVSGSYFFNYTDNDTQSDIVRNYFTSNSLLYNQDNIDRATNVNHRANFRLEYNIDSANKIIITPNITLQDNRLKSVLVGSNMIYDSVFLSRTTTEQLIDNIGYDFSNSIMFQHKFPKQGRTISLNLSGQLAEKNNEGNYNSLNVYTDTTSGLDQLFNTYSNNKKASANLSYTEPLNKVSQLQLNYNPSYNIGLSNKSTNDYNSVNDQYSDFNTALSNKYDNVYQTQRAGLSYKYNKDKLNVTIGADAQQSTLTGNQTYPVTFDINQSFQNILPNLHFNYKMSKTKNLRINYRSSTNIPSVAQLQNVIDISNPLQVKEGNTSLKQTFENNLNVRFGGFDTKTSRNAMIFVNGGFTENYISNATFILRSDSVIQGYEVKAGSQLSKPVNLSGYYNGRAYFVYGFPVKAIKCNLNFNGGINYSHTPALINNILNYSHNYAGNGGIFIGSNISQNIDFSLGYNGNYTIVKNTVQTVSDNNFFNHSATAKLNWIINSRFVINSDVTHMLYNGLTQNFNQRFLLWNAYLGYKFLKNKSLEAKVSVYDILKQNQSISRTITGNYSEDNRTKVLQRFFMFTLTYTFRNFKNGTPPNEEEKRYPFQGMPPGGMPPH